MLTVLKANSYLSNYFLGDLTVSGDLPLFSGIFGPIQLLLGIYSYLLAFILGALLFLDIFDFFKAFWDI